MKRFLFIAFAVFGMFFVTAQEASPVFQTNDDVVSVLDQSDVTTPIATIDLHSLEVAVLDANVNVSAKKVLNTSESYSVAIVVKSNRCEYLYITPKILHKTDFKSDPGSETITSCKRDIISNGSGGMPGYC